jgi:nucleoside-diphosphate-sugar epimerase
MDVLITGANGFIGESLSERMVELGKTVRGSVRFLETLLNCTETINVGDINKNTNWNYALDNINIVIHLAARVHVMNEVSSDPLRDYRIVNVEGTVNLANQAATMGVKRFIYISSIKVNGESTEYGAPFKADDEPHPSDPYGISKHEAEIELKKISEKTGMELVIIRPPLVYGNRVKANLGNLIRLINYGFPLPLAAIKNNRRSFVSLDNLNDLIITCLEHPSAAGQIFLVSDNEDISTRDLVIRIGVALGISIRLFYVPIFFLNLIFILINRKHLFQRLCCSLELDINKTKFLLNWTPPFSFDEGLAKAFDNSMK